MPMRIGATGGFRPSVLVIQPGGLASEMTRTSASKTPTSPRYQTISSKLILIPDNSGEGQGFATDKEISSWRTAGQAQGKSSPANGSGGAKSPRELSKWAPTSESAVVGADFDREARLGAGWDQFQANEKLFGVTTSFDEALYTTSIDRSAPGFKEREAQASRLAKEILDITGSGNVHLAEERGQIAGQDYDEEDRYGAVLRSATEAGEEADELPAVQMPPVSGRAQLQANAVHGRRRSSISSMNASPDALQAAMHVVSSANETVTRRLSQIGEADLNAILKNEAPVSAKDSKLNADAAEFEPTFDLPAAAPVAHVYPGNGGYGGGSYGRQQGNYYRGNNNGYYPQHQQHQQGYYQPYYDTSAYNNNYYPAQNYYPPPSGHPYGNYPHNPNPDQQHYQQSQQSQYDPSQVAPQTTENKGQQQ